MDLNKLLFGFSILIAFAITSCQNSSSTSICSTKCQAKNKDGVLVCKLSSPEMQERKATVLNSLKKQLLERRELENGYAFKFTGTDEMVDELTEFIKTERTCCGFFTFNLSVSGDASEAWLELTGPDGAKDFVIEELGL